MKRLFVIIALLLLTVWGAKTDDGKLRSSEAQCLLNYLHEVCRPIELPVVVP